MDDVADMLDGMEEGKAQALSYGELITRAIQLRERQQLEQQRQQPSGQANGTVAAAAAAVVPPPSRQQQPQPQAAADDLDFVTSLLASPLVPDMDFDEPADGEQPAPATEPAAAGAGEVLPDAAAGEAGPVVAAAAAVVAAAAEAEEPAPTAVPPPPAMPVMTAEHRRLLHWHWANLEYGCSARLEEVSPAACLPAATCFPVGQLPLQQRTPRSPPFTPPSCCSSRLPPTPATRCRSPPATGTRTRPAAAALAARTAWWWGGTLLCLRR